MLRLFYIIIIAGFFGWACSEDADMNTATIHHLDSCHSLTQWDSLKVVNNLLGLWSLDFYSCSADPGNLQYGTLYLDFKVDGVLYIHTPSSQRTKYSWELRSTSTGFEIESDETASIVSGTILFCKNQMELKNSQNGGCDQFFNKVE